MASNDLGTLLVRLILKGGKEYKKGMGDAGKDTDKTTTKMQRFGSAAKSLASGALVFLGQSIARFVSGGLQDLITGMLDARNALNDAAARSGVAASTIQALGMAFEASGQDAASAEKVLDRWPIIMAEAMRGTGEAAEGMRDLGIAVDGTSDSTEVLNRFIERVQAIEDPTQRSVAAMRVLGRGGGKLLQALGQNAPLRELVEFTERYGTDTGPKASEEAANFQRALATLKTTMNGVKESIVEMLGGMDTVTFALNLIGQTVFFLTSLMQALIEEMKAGFQWMVEIGRAISALASGDMPGFISALSDAKDSFAEMVKGGLGVGAIARAVGTAYAETERYVEDLVKLQDSMDGVKQTAEGFDGTPIMPTGDKAAEDAAFKRMQAFEEQAFDLLEVLKQGEREADALSLILENLPDDAFSPAMISRMREFDERVQEIAPAEGLSRMDELRLLLLDLEMAAAGAGEEAGLYADQITRVQDAIKADKWEAFRETLSKITEGIQKAAGAAANMGSALQTVLGLNLSIGALLGLAQTQAGEGESTKGAVARAVQGLINGSIAAIEAVAANLPIVFNALIGGIPLIVDALVQALPQVLNAVMAGVPPLVQALIAGAVEMMMALIGQLPGFISQLLASLPAVIEQLIAGVAEIVVAIIQAIPSIVSGIIQALPSILTALINGIIQALPSLFTAVITAIPDIAGALIVGIIQALPDLIVAVIAGIVASIPAIIRALIDGIKAAIGSFVSVIGDIFRAALGAIGDLFGGGKDGEKGLIGKTIDAVGSAFSYTGRDYIPATMRVTVHPGERIVSADDAARGATRSNSPSGAPPAPPLPASASSGAGGSSEVVVAFDGRVVAASQVAAIQQGRAPGMQRMMRQRTGVTIGFNRGNLNKWSG